MRIKYGFIISIVALIWAGSFIAVKIGVDEISPVSLAFLGFAIASPLSIASFVHKKEAPSIFY